MGRVEVDEEFTAFVRARQHALVRFGYVLTGDPSSGEDLAQTALARLYLKWDTIERTEATEAWVRKVMVNEHTSWWRRAWRHRETVGLDAVNAEAVALSAPAGDHELWQEVLRLPPRQRAAVALRYYEDLTEAQTAEILGCSVGTVKSQVHRALATLRTRLEEVLA
ncbi:MAG: SigE family RNA polymerase sigma factor [Intrasporangium sp.]|uniref:SigE family RNA polymerase sigma factor n=1 Tax=Intrasporangium sp. TaxID=1925024 RepID=UPI003F812541